MAGDGIRAYAGEFLVSPAGLELSMNWCGHQCSYCIEEDSPVMLASMRTKPGKAVQVGDVLLGFESRGPGGHWQWAAAVVEETFAREVPGVRVHLANGESVVCTADHHFWTGRRGAKAYAPICTVGPYSRQVVRPGKALHRINFPLLPEEPFTDDYRRGYIRGLLEGDASTTPYGAWRIALTDVEPLDRVAAFVAELGWGTVVRGEFKDYTATPERRPMQQVYFPVSHPVSRLMGEPDGAEGREYWRGWLAGIYDAEGNTPARRGLTSQSALRICQYRQANPETYGRIEQALALFGFQFVNEERAIRLVNSDGLAAPLFVQLVQPAITRKARPLIGRSLKGMQQRIPVVRVEDAGMIRVASFRTSTHNYVSGGFLSRNCFANAFKPDRKADLTAIMGLLANYRTRSTREAKLLQAGVPMLVSNHVDPFAGTNAEQFEPIWELLMELQIPLTWQTRGAHKPQRKFLERVIRENPPSAWYISIPMLDDAVRKRVEPMAPSIESRFELIEQLVDAGHMVTVGVNPLSLDWVPDFEPLLTRIRDLGAWGAWIEVPYFAQTFKNNLTPKQVGQLTPEFIKRCGERGNAMDIANAREAMDFARQIGLQVFSTSYEEATEFFDPWHEIYERPMPYWHQLINVVDLELDEDDDESFVIVTKQDAMEILDPLPELDWAEPLRHKNAKHYRAITNPHGKLPKQDVAGFWNLIWNDEVYAKALGPNSFKRFAHASIRDGDTIIPLVDDNGDRIVVYRRKGWKYVYADTPELLEFGELDEEAVMQLDGMELEPEAEET